MDGYSRKNQTLRAGERDLNIVRASSPQVTRSAGEAARSSSVERPSRADEDKLARIKDLNALSSVFESVKKSCADFQAQVEEQRAVTKRELEDLSKQILSVKQEAELAKSERLKQKLDSFITTYNDNELAHSNSFKEIEKTLKEICERMEQFESLL